MLRTGRRNTTTARGGLNVGASLALGVIGPLIATAAVVGADCYWVVAMGDWIFDSRALPTGVPFAQAPTQDWPNVLVLAQMTFAAVHGLGTDGLLLLQLALSVVALGLVGISAQRHGASDPATGLVLLLVVVGNLTAFGIIRLQILSLVPFTVLVLLLRSEHRTPSRRVWLVPVLIALWGNLHGAVLVGVAVAGAYLLCSRLRREPLVALAVGLSTVSALAANPEGLRSASYYLGVFGNEAAVRRSDLWSSPSLENGFDVLMLLVLAALLALAVRQAPPLWEGVVLAGLALGTVVTARNGLWLSLFVAPLAAGGLKAWGVPGSESARRALGGGRALPRSVLIGGVAAGMALAVIRDPGTVQPVTPQVVARVVHVAGDDAVLASEPAVESFAQAGARVWVSDPIDAFPRRYQQQYLDFLTGDLGGVPLLARAQVVAVEEGSPPARLVEQASHLTLIDSVDGWRIYRRS